MHFKRKELEKFRSLKGPLIDVRSPDEYYKGHMPNSINIPLFNNDERSIIGKTYKRFGKEKAVFEGLKITENKIENLLNNIFEIINTYKSKNKNRNLDELILRFYCARGGMRSLSVSWLLDKYNFKSITLYGGYKKYRKWVLESFIKKWNIVVIGGKTGTGKTKLLKLLEENNYQIIDLEGLASHRGSTFGGLGMPEQPTNEYFENAIAEKLYSFKDIDNVFVEAESANIGKCKIPHEFFKQMKCSRRIEIQRSQSNRIAELIKTYSIFSQDELKDAVLRIKKRLGPQRTKFALESIQQKKWDLVCKSVLEYYDKCYDFEKAEVENIMCVDLTDLNYDKNILRLINSVL